MIAALSDVDSMPERSCCIVHRDPDARSASDPVNMRCEERACTAERRLATGLNPGSFFL
jgi:hypothetical protein